MFWVVLATWTVSVRPAASVSVTDCPTARLAPKCQVPYEVRDAPWTLVTARMEFSTNSSLGFPVFSRMTTLPVRGQGTNFQLVPVGLPTEYPSWSNAALLRSRWPFGLLAQTLFPPSLP